MSDLDALAQFRAGAQDQPRRNVEEAYRFTGTILAVDQSIANSGWAFVESGQDHFMVHRGGTVKTDALATGHEDTLRRAVSCYIEYRLLIAQYHPDWIVHELPPVGNHMARPESSLCSSVALRLAAHETGTPIRMIGAQRAKKVITGNGNAQKREVKEKLKELLPDLANLKPMNEAIIDAVALAWVAVREAPGG